MAPKANAINNLEKTMYRNKLRKFLLLASLAAAGAVVTWTLADFVAGAAPDYVQDFRRH